MQSDYSFFFGWLHFYLKKRSFFFSHFMLHLFHPFFLHFDEILHLLIVVCINGISLFFLLFFSVWMLLCSVCDVLYYYNVRRRHSVVQSSIFILQCLNEICRFHRPSPETLSQKTRNYSLFACTGPRAKIILIFR